MSVEQPVNQTINDEPVVEFVPLLNFEDNYEILNQHPFTIRKKSNHRIITEGNYNRGYPRVSLNQKSYLKHVIIAKQFLPNDDPEHKTQVDHISRDRTDYHLSNLRYVSPSSNCYNKSSHKGTEYEFVDDIPDEAMIIDYYDLKNGERREFESHKYYFYHDNTNDEDKFFGKITDNLYKVLHINTNKSGNELIRLIDIDNKPVSVYINRYKFQHDLL